MYRNTIRENVKKFIKEKKQKKSNIMMSRASEVGSPTNHLGFRQRQDKGPCTSCRYESCGHESARHFLTGSGTFHKINERPSGAPVATGITCAPGVPGILVINH